MRKQKHIYYSWIGLIVLGIIWGSSFIIMKLGLRSFDYVQVASIRIFSAFVFLVPLSIKFFKKLNRTNIISILIVGFIGNLIPSILFPLGQTNIDSSLAGILNSLVPVFVLITGIAFFKLKANPFQIIGVLIGFFGAVILMTNDDFLLYKSFNFHSLYIILATLLYALNMNQVNKYLKSLRGIEITALSFLFIGPVSGAHLLFSDFSKSLSSETVLIDLFLLIILGLFASAIAVIIINYIIVKSGAMFASSVTYIIPVFAIMWGVIDGEFINFLKIIATIIVILGVYLVNKK